MATTQQLLDEARTAYHQLMTGRSARVVVDGGSGERIEFTAANKQGLYAYIKQLESALSVETGSTPINNGPMSFTF